MAASFFTLDTWLVPIGDMERLSWALRARVLGAPEISSDGWNCYPGAIEDAFGIDVTYGQIQKHYGVQAGVVEAARRYSPAQVVAVSKLLVGL